MNQYWINANSAPWRWFNVDSTSWTQCNNTRHTRAFKIAFQCKGNNSFYDKRWPMAKSGLPCCKSHNIRRNIMSGFISVQWCAICATNKTLQNLISRKEITLCAFGQKLLSVMECHNHVNISRTGTRRHNDVALTSIWRDDVASVSVRRHLDVDRVPAGRADQSIWCWLIGIRSMRVYIHVLFCQSWYRSDTPNSLNYNCTG